jgi:hypothetical protein
MTNKLKCQYNSLVPYGVTGSKSAYDESLSTVYPAINHKVHVSFNVDDCKIINMDVLSEGILEQAIEYIDAASLSGLTKAKDLSLSDKKLIVLEKGGDYTINNHLAHLSAEDVQYYKDFFSKLSCLINIEFEVTEEKFSDKDISEYKVAICATNNHVLRDNMNQVAHAFISIGEKPTECFIAIDNQDSEPTAYRKNTLGHEFLHCLGLNHPTYKSIAQNKAHRSIMEDLSPIIKSCARKSTSILKFVECAKFPTLFTDEDICALNDIYGSSTDESAYCREVVYGFIEQYPYLTLESSNNNFQSDL